MTFNVREPEVAAEEVTPEFDFSQLNPDLILDAIESKQVYPESGLLALNSYENRVYQFKADDGKRYVVKFYRPKRWSNEQIQEEHDFAQLLADNDIDAVAPVRFDGQSLMEFNGYRFCLFPSVGGRMFELDDLDQLERLGQLLGRVHALSAESTFAHRDTIDIKTDLETAFEYLKQSDLIPNYLQAAFFNDLELMIQASLNHVTSDYQVIRLHGDCHSGNILWQPGQEQDDAILVDFDDCVSGPAIQDLWMMLNGDRNQQLLQLDTLIEGYEQFRPFDRSEFKLIEPLRARRMLMYMTWLAKRWQDPAFQRNFSWFNTDKYWEQQVLAIKEQFSALQQEPLKLGF